MNARIDEVLQDPEIMPKQFIDYDFQPTKWTAFDVIMIFVGTMCNRYSDFNAELANLAFIEYLNSEYDSNTAWDIFDQIKWVNDPGAPTTVPDTGTSSIAKVRRGVLRRMPGNGKGVLNISYCRERTIPQRQKRLYKDWFTWPFRVSFGEQSLDCGRKEDIREKGNYNKWPSV